MAKDATKKRQSNIATGPTLDLDEQIRCRAYELYEQRGRENGHDLEDWLRARAEIAGRRVRAIDAP
jgi:DUF2934 family protein